MPQLRTAEERWFGRALQLIIAGGVTRKVHWEEAHVYYITTTGASGAVTLNMPYDVRNYTLGGPKMLVISSTASTRSIEMRDSGGALLPDGIIVPGEGGLVFLTSVATAAGSWWVLDRLWGPATKLS